MSRQIQISNGHQINTLQVQRPREKGSLGFSEGFFVDFSAIPLVAHLQEGALNL